MVRQAVRYVRRTEVKYVVCNAVVGVSHSVSPSLTKAKAADRDQGSGVYVCCCGRSVH